MRADEGTRATRHGGRHAQEKGAAGLQERADSDRTERPAGRFQPDTETRPYPQDAASDRPIRERLGRCDGAGRVLVPDRIALRNPSGCIEVESSEPGRKRPFNPESTYSITHMEHPHAQAAQARHSAAMRGGNAWAHAVP